jgi:hypothetical protein
MSVYKNCAQEKYFLDSVRHVVDAYSVPHVERMFEEQENNAPKDLLKACTNKPA